MRKGPRTRDRGTGTPHPGQGAQGPHTGSGVQGPGRSREVGPCRGLRGPRLPSGLPVSVSGRGERGRPGGAVGTGNAAGPVPAAAAASLRHPQGQERGWRGERDRPGTRLRGARSWPGGAFLTGQSRSRLSSAPLHRSSASPLRSWGGGEEGSPHSWGKATARGQLAAPRAPRSASGHGGDRGEAERGVGVQPPIPRYLPEGWHSPKVSPGWAVLPQVCSLQPRGADSSAEGLTCAWPGCTGNSGICAVEGSSVPSVPPGRSEASFSNPQLIPCTTTFLHGAAPLSPQPALLSLDAAFWDDIWYFQCYFPPSLPFPWVLFVLLAVSLGLWGGFLLPVGL